LACGPRTGRRARAGLRGGGGAGVRVGDDRGGGDDEGAPPVSGTGRGLRLRRGWVGYAGPCGWLAGPQGASGLERKKKKENGLLLGY
jgi:hypothetical protein